MPAYTIVALICLVVAGGVIAWLGDIIGYRLGKRRSSLFGMRPRTTARTVGIAVGAALPLIGLGVAASGSSYVQDALFNIQRLRESRDSLTQQVVNLNGQKVEAEQTADEARSNADIARQKAEALQADATALQSERDELQDEVNRVQSDLKAAEIALAHSKRQLEAMQKQNQALEKQQQDLEANIEGLEATLQSTEGQLDVVNRDLEDKKRQLEPLEEELALKRTQLRELTGRLMAWQQASYGPVLYESGHELVRDVIRSDQTLEQIRSSLVEDIVLASKVAHASGVKVEEGRRVRVWAPRPEGKRLGEVSEEWIVQAVARGIHQGEEHSYVVSIKTLARVFVEQPEPEPVPVVLVAIPNSRVYARGEVIVRTRIDGGEPRDQVFGQVWGILAALRREAQEHGVLPHPETGQYGDVPAEELLAALDQLLSAGAPQTVRATAAEDVYRAGMQPFLVIIEVGEEPET